MLTPDLEFNQKLVVHSTVYRYQLWEQPGDGIDMTWCIILDDEKIPRKGDNFPVYEVPPGKLVLLDEFVFCPAWASSKTIIAGSIGRISCSGQYHITLNAGAHSCEINHVSLWRPIAYFGGEWIGVCPHLLGKRERAAFRMTLRFREVPLPKDAAPGKINNIVSFNVPPEWGPDVPATIINSKPNLT
jgi:hypothetical protein